MAKFRNVLIHRYAIVKTENLVEIIKFHLVDVVEFMKEIKKLLKKEKEKNLNSVKCL
jgi:uncharacterized protein YutE (UPF0331/DUF86 family)